jgi:hypothetical protein
MFLLGNVEAVSALTGVDSHNIRAWMKTEWWKEAMATLRYEQNQQTDVKLQKVVEKSLDIVADRLEHGDLVLNNKTGELVQKPVSMKDAAMVARDLMTRQGVMRKEEEGAVQQKDTVQQTLKILATEFARWDKKPTNEDVIDIEDAKEL